MRQLLSLRTIERLIFLLGLALVVGGLREPTELYLSPQSGLGYALGIVGGSMMLLLIVYPLRKRVRALAFLGGIPQWFRVHMLLGIGGPLCILFHSNFSLGATNSNVALFCMLVVAGSGIVGRYFYSKIHHGLYGRKATLTELQAKAAALRGRHETLSLLPELMSRLDAEDKKLLRWGNVMLLGPFLIAALALQARIRISRYVRHAVRVAAASSETLRSQRPRIERAALDYSMRRIRASREVAEFRVYERLFSLWHVLHLPLFFMLLAAGIVHVIAVHVY
jgi:hypothetical protein